MAAALGPMAQYLLSLAVGLITKELKELQGKAPSGA